MKTKRRKKKRKRTTPTNRQSCASRTKTRPSLQLAVGFVVSPMSRETKDVALLKKLWSVGQSSDTEPKCRVRMAFNAARIGLSRLMLWCGPLEMMMRRLACESRRGCHQRHNQDRDQRSHCK